MNKYDDIINLEHYEPKYHKRMSMESRASQFAPFAALTGYGDAVNETARLTDSKHELDDDVKSDINYKLQIINKNIDSKPLVRVKYFVPDKKKNGGKYIEIFRNVRKIDDYKHIVIMDNKLEIPIDNIIDISSDCIDYNDYC